MFPERFWSASYWAARFWAKFGADPVVVVATTPAARTHTPRAEVRTCWPDGGALVTSTGSAFEETAFDDGGFEQAAVFSTSGARVFTLRPETRTVTA